MEAKRKSLTQPTGHFDIEGLIATRKEMFGDKVFPGDGAELVREARAIREAQKSGGIDFDKLASTCERLEIEEDESGWPEEFDAPALSRRALGLD